MWVPVATLFICGLLLSGYYFMPDSTIGKSTQFLFAATYYRRSRAQLFISERSMGLDLTLLVLCLSAVGVVSGAKDLFQAKSRFHAFKRAYPDDAENGLQ